MNPNQLEQAAIGMALLSARDLHDMAGVRAEWFQNPVHADIWRIMQKLDADGLTLDPFTVVTNNHLADPVTRQQITVKYLQLDCVDQAPPGHMGHTYTRNLREAHDRHVTSQALTRAQQMLAEGVSTPEVRLEAMAGLQAVTDLESALVTTNQSVDETLRGFDEITPYTPTPWAQLNKAIRGWRPGGLYVVGARPGVGKSLLLQKAALSLAEHGPVILETMEMTHTEVTTRLLSIMTGIDQSLMVGRRSDGTSGLSPKQFEQLREAGMKLKGLPLMYGERTQMPVDVREHARALSSRGKLAGIFVDYLQLMGTGRNIGHRTQELTVITRELKQIAMEFHCPVIIASQLNRNAANENRPPISSELRDSGSIEQDADVTILLHADPQIVNSVFDGVDVGVPLDAIIDKNRQGPKSVALLRRFGTTAQINDDARPRIGAKPPENLPPNRFEKGNI